MSKSLNYFKYWFLGIGISIILGVATWWIPIWQVPSGIVDVKEIAELENSYRTTLIQALGGLFFLVTASLTLRNIRLADDKQVAERFSKSVEMLGNSEKLEVRVGGIYSLEKISEDSAERYSSVVIDILASFVKRNSMFIEIKKYDENLSRAELYQYQAIGIEVDQLKELESIPSDIQAALSVLKRLSVSMESRTSLNLSFSRLVGADLRESKFNNIDLRSADLTLCDCQDVRILNSNLSFIKLRGSVLIGASLAGCNLLGGKLYRSDCRNANFKKSNLSGVDFRKANLTGAILNSSNMVLTDLRGANLQGADLRGADLRGAKLEDAIMNDADISGADLSNVTWFDKVLLEYGEPWEKRCDWARVRGISTAKLPKALMHELKVEQNH